jgi:hypothetical protein
MRKSYLLFLLPFTLVVALLTLMFRNPLLRGIGSTAAWIVLRLNTPSLSENTRHHTRRNHNA